MEYKLHALKSVSKIKQHALKGQKLLAQGIALGNNDSKRVALKGQKLSNTRKIFKAFALSQGAFQTAIIEGASWTYDTPSLYATQKASPIVLTSYSSF